MYTYMSVGTIDYNVLILIYMYLYVFVYVCVVMYVFIWCNLDQDNAIHLLITEGLSVTVKYFSNDHPW